MYEIKPYLHGLSLKVYDYYVGTDYFNYECAIFYLEHHIKVPMYL
jgi:hypothetical protein